MEPRCVVLVVPGGAAANVNETNAKVVDAILAADPAVQVLSSTSTAVAATATSTTSTGKNGNRKGANGATGSTSGNKKGQGQNVVQERDENGVLWAKRFLGPNSEFFYYYEVTN